MLKEEEEHQSGNNARHEEQIYGFESEKEEASHSSSCTLGALLSDSEAKKGSNCVFGLPGEETDLFLSQLMNQHQQQTPIIERKVMPEQRGGVNMYSVCPPPPPLIGIQANKGGRKGGLTVPGGVSSRPKCLECGKDFSNQSALSKHRLTHSDERRFVCSTCSKAFKRQDHLNGHMLTHRDKKPFQCNFIGCEKTYCDARSLKRHKDNHHQQLQQQQVVAAQVLNVKQMVATQNRIQYAPPATQQPILQQPAETLFIAANIEEGMLSLEKEEDPQNLLHQLLTQQNSSNSNSMSFIPAAFPLDEEEGEVVCNICGKKFKTIPALNGHMRLHGGYNNTQSKDWLERDFQEPIMNELLKERLLQPQMEFDFPKTELRGEESTYVAPPVAASSSQQLFEQPSGEEDFNLMMPGVVSFSFSPLHLQQYQREQQQQSFKEEEEVTKSAPPTPQNEIQTFFDASKGFWSHGQEESERSLNELQEQQLSEQLTEFMERSMTPVVEVEEEKFQEMEFEESEEDEEEEAVFATPGVQKKSKKKPMPLFIPPHLSNYHNTGVNKASPRMSLLHQTCTFFNRDSEASRAPPYTPPPMLSPVRTHSGFYWHIIHSAPTTTTPPALESDPLHWDESEKKVGGPLLTPYEKDENNYESLLQLHETSNVLPHVNIGVEFQARIPLCQQKPYSQQKETLLWHPNTLDKEKESDLNHLLDILCSSLVPGGGRNKELGHHLFHLFEADFDSCLQFVLQNPKKAELMTQVKEKLGDYKYNETSVWTKQEIEEYQQALHNYDKDFRHIAKAVKTKSVKECVEFYYLWKKVCVDEYRRLRVIRRKKEEESLSMNLRNKQIKPREEEPQEEEDEEEEVVEKKVKSEKAPSGEGPTIYACKVCGKCFTKVKSRSAHMKIHGSQKH